HRKQPLAIHCSFTCCIGLDSRRLCFELRRGNVVGRKHLLQSLGLILVLSLTIAAAAYAQNSVQPNGSKPSPSDTGKMPPANPQNTPPPSPGVCPQLQRIGPFLTSDEAELAA